jgi:hypothetical protein
MLDFWTLRLKQHGPELLLASRQIRHEAAAYRDSYTVLAVTGPDTGPETGLPEVFTNIAARKRPGIHVLRLDWWAGSYLCNVTSNTINGRSWWQAKFLSTLERVVMVRKFVSDETLRDIIKRAFPFASLQVDIVDEEEF